MMSSFVSSTLAAAYRLVEVSLYSCMWAGLDTGSAIAIKNSVADLKRGEKASRKIVPLFVIQIGL